MCSVAASEGFARPGKSRGVLERIKVTDGLGNTPQLGYLQLVEFVALERKKKMTVF